MTALPACVGEARTTTVAARVCRPTPPIDKSDAEKKSGTGIEREPDAERLLARGAFRPFQLLGNFGRGGPLFGQRLQFSNLGRRPGAPLL